MTGFYETRILYILVELYPTSVVAKDMWAIFESIYFANLQKLKGKTKYNSFMSTLSTMQKNKTISKTWNPIKCKYEFYISDYNFQRELVETNDCVDTLLYFSTAPMGFTSLNDSLTT